MAFPSVLLSYIFSPDAARLVLSRTLWGTTSPSDCVNSFATIEKTVLGPGGPRYGRSSDRFGPPTTLFNRELTVLQYDLEHLEALTPSSMTISHAFDLVANAAEFYSEEDLREHALRTTLKNLLRESQWQVLMTVGSGKPDSVWLEGFFAYLIFQLKNEPGLGGDPFLQSLAVYSKIINQDEVSSPLASGDCPSIKLLQTVPRIHFAIESTRCPAKHGGKLSRGVDRHLY